MSQSPTRREVAYRLFASEFNDSTYTYAESDEERAPNYLLTPTGARVNRLFVVGVLTEVEHVSDDVVRARVVDPTEAFVVYAGQYQPEALAFFERVDPPLFVAVTGKGRTFQPEGSDRVFTSIRPETVNEVDAETRDRWVVQTAEYTAERVAIFAKALQHDARGSDLQSVLEAAGVQPGIAAGIPRAIEEYDTGETYLAAMQELAIDAARLVGGEIDQVDSPTIQPDVDGVADINTSFADHIVLHPDDESAESAQEPEPPASEPTSSTAAASSGEPDRESATEPADVSSEVSFDREASESDEGYEEPEEIEPGPEAEPDHPDESNTGTEPGEAAPGQEAIDEENLAGEVETDEMYELSEAERQEVRDNFEVEFESGSAFAEEESDTEPESEGGPEPSGESTDEAETEPVEDLEDTVVETMQREGGTDGIARDQLIATVMDEYAVEESAVEDAIEDALLGGRCFESGEDRLKPI